MRCAPQASNGSGHLGSCALQPMPPPGPFPDDGGASRRRACHSAAPPSPFSRCFNMDGEEVPPIRAAILFCVCEKVHGANSIRTETPPRGRGGLSRMTELSPMARLGPGGRPERDRVPASQPAEHDLSGAVLLVWATALPCVGHCLALCWPLPSTAFPCVGRCLAVCCHCLPPPFLVLATALPCVSNTIHRHSYITRSCSPRDSARRRTASRNALRAQTAVSRRLSSFFAQSADALSPRLLRNLLRNLERTRVLNFHCLSSCFHRLSVAERGGHRRFFPASRPGSGYCILSESCSAFNGWDSRRRDCHFAGTT